MSEEFEAPTAIYLQPEMGEEGETTWCENQISDEDIIYVRGDLYEQLRARITEFEARLAEAEQDAERLAKALGRSLDDHSWCPSCSRETGQGAAHKEDCELYSVLAAYRARKAGKP